MVFQEDPTQRNPEKREVANLLVRQITGQAEDVQYLLSHKALLEARAKDDDSRPAATHLAWDMGLVQDGEITS